MNGEPFTGVRVNRDRPASLPWLTVLRYPAAIWVILIHSLNAVQTNLGADAIRDSPFKTFIDHGFLGVSFFFVLSGFILAWNYPRITSRRDYLVARAARILPVYYLALLISLPFVFTILMKEGLSIGILFKAATVLTLTQAWIPRISTFWNGPSWTLSCEAFFYISLIFVLPVAQRIFAGKPVARTMAAVALIWVLGLIAPAIYCWKFGAFLNPSILNGTQAFLQEKGAKLFVERFPLLRVLEFVTGVIACIGVRTAIPRIGRQWAMMLLLGGAAWIAVAVFLPFILSMGTLCLPGFVCVIVGAAALPGPVESQTLRFATLLGNASYAVYLFHVPIRDYLMGFYEHTFGSNALGGMPLLLAIFIATTTISTALSILIFLRYEEPMRVWVKRLLSPRAVRLTNAETCPP